MKKQNNFIITIIVLVMIMSIMTACSKTEPSNNTSTNNPTTGQPATEQPTSKEATGNITLEGAYIITTCGQSPGAVMLNMVATQAGKKSTIDNELTAEGLKAGEYKTLIVTTGTSMKGMGAAGTDVNAEIKRCVNLIKAAKEAGITIVGAHIEGMARRVDSTDAASIDAVMKLADVILVIKDSDSDGFFTKYSQDNNKPLIKVKDALAISSVLN